MPTDYPAALRLPIPTEGHESNDTHDFLHGDINLFQKFFIYLKKGAFNQPLVVDRTDLVDHQIRILVKIAGSLNTQSQGFNIFF